MEPSDKRRPKAVSKNKLESIPQYEASIPLDASATIAVELKFCRADYRSFARDFPYIHPLLRYCLQCREDFAARLSRLHYVRKSSVVTVRHLISDRSRTLVDRTRCKCSTVAELPPISVLPRQAAINFDGWKSPLATRSQFGWVG
jgi:hypothetical protein